MTHDFQKVFFGVVPDGKAQVSTSSDPKLPGSGGGKSGKLLDRHEYYFKIHRMYAGPINKYLERRREAQNE